MASTPAKKTPAAKKKTPAKPRARKPAAPAASTPVPPSGKHPRIHPNEIAAERARATTNFAPVPAAKRRRRR